MNIMLYFLYLGMAFSEIDSFHSLARNEECMLVQRLGYEVGQGSLMPILEFFDTNLSLTPLLDFTLAHFFPHLVAGRVKGSRFGCRMEISAIVSHLLVPRPL